MSQIGRIGGQVLADNLLRAGVDLAFETDLLYLDVANRKIGVKTSSPAYVLDIDNQIKSINGIATSLASIDNILIQSPNVFATTVGPINIMPAGPNATALFEKLATQHLVIDGNSIKSTSNQNIRFDPSGVGTVELQANTAVTGSVFVTGNIAITGDLSKQGNLILGDDVIDGEGNVPENDLVDFNAPFSQDLVPGADNAFDLGGSLGDSTAGRWKSATILDSTNITTIRPSNAIVSDQIFFNGTVNSITAIQSNDDISLDPATGISFVEATRWHNDIITNLLDTPLTIAATGTGYYNFAGTNGIVLPAGNSASRPAAPEVGDTRYNTEEGYLECFDGTIYIISIGPSPVISVQDMEDLGNLYALVLG